MIKFKIFDEFLNIDLKQTSFNNVQIYNHCALPQKISDLNLFVNGEACDREAKDALNFVKMKACKVVKKNHFKRFALQHA